MWLCFIFSDVHRLPGGCVCPSGTPEFLHVYNFESCIINHYQIYSNILYIYSNIIRSLGSNLLLRLRCFGSNAALNSDEVRWSLSHFPFTRFRCWKARVKSPKTASSALACRNPARSHPSVTICFWWTLEIKPLSLCQATSGHLCVLVKKTGIQIDSSRLRNSSTQTVASLCFFTIYHCLRVTLRTTPALFASRTPCNPCLFFNSPAGCFRGRACTFCHHQAMASASADGRSRPSKLSRERTKEQAESERWWSFDLWVFMVMSADVVPQISPNEV